MVKATIKRVDGEYVVRCNGSTYFTDDRDDAEATARAMERKAWEDWLLSATVAEEEEIARSNFECAIDSIGHDYQAAEAAHAAYLVNAIDTARERRVSAEAVARGYLRRVIVVGSGTVLERDHCGCGASMPKGGAPYGGKPSGLCEACVFDGYGLGED